MSAASSELRVAGSIVTAAEAKWVRYVRDVAVAKLSGTPADRAHKAAVVAWWSLKEGVLDAEPSPYRHNLCTQGAVDVHLGDLDVCTGPAWQVGLSGVQMPNVSDATVLATAQALYPGMTTDALLAAIAQAAGIDPTSSTTAAIVASSGRLRASWLARDPAIGITLNMPFADDCVSGDLEARFLAPAPTPAPTPTPVPVDGGSPVVDPCAGAALGDGAYCATYFDASADSKTLLSCAGKKTTLKTTCANGCMRMPDGENDACASAPLSTVRAAMMTRAESWRAAHMPYCGATPGAYDGICMKTCTERQTPLLT